MEHLCNDLTKILSNKKAKDIIVLDFKKKSSITDYFIIATADSIRQIDALVLEISKYAKKNDIDHKPIQGEALSGWVIIDFYSTIVHIFSEEVRLHYRLEDLWGHLAQKKYV